MNEIARILFLFGYAFLFAAVEIEIEGPHGWAAQLPTWYRRTPGYARLFSTLMEGKPLTGYHLFMFGLPLASFHMPFVWGTPWSPSAEAAVLAAYPVWVVTWDFLWFLFNPAYGWTRFHKGQIWWMDSAWIGRMPIDYVKATVFSFGVAGVGAFMAGDAEPLRMQIHLVGGMAGLAGVAGTLAPRYHRWYAHMRRAGADERGPAPPQPVSPPVAAPDEVPGVHED